MNGTESMILEKENNNILYDKADKDYKDITKIKTYGMIWKAIGKKDGMTGNFFIEINFILAVSTMLWNCKNKCLHNFIK